MLQAWNLLKEPTKAVSQSTSLWETLYEVKSSGVEEPPFPESPKPSKAEDSSFVKSAEDKEEKKQAESLQKVYPYFTWPLEFQQERHKPHHEETVVKYAILKVIGNYGELSLTETIAQTIYLICNRRGYRGSVLERLLEPCDLNLDYNGGMMKDCTFEPSEDDVKQLRQYFAKCPEARDEATKIIKINKAMQFFNLNGDIFQIAKFSDIIEKKDFKIHLSMKADQYIKAKDNDVRDFYAALKSLAGGRECFEISKSVLLARVLGFKSDCEIPNVYKESEVYKKYSKRHHMDKMIETLKEAFDVKTAWCGRKVAVTILKSVSQQYLNKWAAGRVSKRKNKPGNKKEVLSLLQG